MIDARRVRCLLLSSPWYLRGFRNQLVIEVSLWLFEACSFHQAHRLQVRKTKLIEHQNYYSQVRV